jgi:hypothetical protein
LEEYYTSGRRQRQSSNPLAERPLPTRILCGTVYPIQKVESLEDSFHTHSFRESESAAEPGIQINKVEARAGVAADNAKLMAWQAAFWSGAFLSAAS